MISDKWHNINIYKCPDCQEIYENLSEAERCCNGFGIDGYECKKCGDIYEYHDEVTCCIDENSDEEELK